MYEHPPEIKIINMWILMITLVENDMFAYEVGK